MQPGRVGQARGRVVNVRRMGGGGLGSGAEVGQAQPGALAVFRRGDRVGDLAQDRWRVIVEADQPDETGLDIGHRHRQRRHVVHLPAQVDPHVADHRRAVRRQRVDETAPALRAAQARFPGECDRVHRGGDAVGEQLRLSVAQRDRGGEVDSGPRLQLPLERVAVQVDNSGQREQTTPVEALRAAGGRSDPQPALAIDQHRRLGDAPIAQQHARALHAHQGHVQHRLSTIARL